MTAKRTTPPAPTVENLVDGILAPTEPQVWITVPPSEFIVYGAMLKVFVEGLTKEESQSVPIQSEASVRVSFPNWPGANNGSEAEAWYTVTPPGGGQPPHESDRTPFHVGPRVAPAITQVLDTKGIDIPQDGMTASTAVSLVGTARANERLEVWQDGQLKGHADIGGDGQWRYEINGMPLGTHNFQVRGLYGNPPPDSNVRTLTVVNALTIDGPTSVAVNGTFQCTASGGVPPYAFSSGDTTVATIDSQSGDGQGKKIGSTVITVTDAASYTATHALQVTAALAISGPSTVDAGDTFQCTASGGRPSYTFQSSNTNIATIDNAGNGLAVSAGNCTITVTDSVGDRADHALAVRDASPVFDDLRDVAPSIYPRLDRPAMVIEATGTYGVSVYSSTGRCPNLPFRLMNPYNGNEHLKITFKRAAKRVDYEWCHGDGLLAATFQFLDEAGVVLGSNEHPLPGYGRGTFRAPEGKLISVMRSVAPGYTSPIGGFTIFYS